jgi:patatin-like phospholipase/acyl hydrolase
VAGTSTGALVASAIAAGLPATEILGIYQNRAKEIFNHSTDEAWVLRMARGYAFDPANIQKVLVAEFGSASAWTLNDCPIGILLTAKSVNEHPWYFVRDTPNNAQTTGGLSLIDCAVASASAPTYFAPWRVSPAKIPIGWCFDGGTGVTGNPVYQACVEAFEYDCFDARDTRVISLGTGFYPDSAMNPPRGLLRTLTWTIDALVGAPEDQQTEITQRQWPGIMQRFNWQLPSAIDMANVSAIPQLIQIGQAAAHTMDWKKILSIA